MENERGLRGRVLFVPETPLLCRVKVFGCFERDQVGQIRGCGHVGIHLDELSLIGVDQGDRNVSTGVSPAMRLPNARPMGAEMINGAANMPAIGFQSRKLYQRIFPGDEYGMES